MLLPLFAAMVTVATVTVTVVRRVQRHAVVGRDRGLGQGGGERERGVRGTCGVRAEGRGGRRERGEEWRSGGRGIVHCLI